MVDSVEWFVADLPRAPAMPPVNRHAIEVAVPDGPGGATILDRALEA